MQRLSPTACPDSPPIPLAAAVRWWLWGLCAMVVCMILLGGATRLTDSGLSMVEWQPLTILPPLSHDDWSALFAKYQQTPQYRLRTSGMDLAAFEGIFWLEYIHRLWGRAIGAAVLIPLLVFGWRGMIPRGLWLRMAGLFVLGGLQGGLGWYMVASGLVDRPDVSQYRLAAHLALALALYGALFWTALTYGKPVAPFAQRPWAGITVLIGLVFLTMIAGAFVAGLDAGLTYNTFPLMDGHILPTGWNILISWWRNLFENIPIVQFNHRLLAVSTFVYTFGFWAWAVWRARQSPEHKALADRLRLIALAVSLQAGLGISTLLLVVPIPLALAHQAGGIMVLSLTLWLGGQRD